MSDNIVKIKKNIVLNCFRTALGILFPLITFPYISRVLGASGVGKISFASSIISYFSFLAALGVTTYAIREGAALKEDIQKRNVFFNEVFSINFLSMALSYLLLGVLLIVSVKLQDNSLLLAVFSLNLFFNWLGVEWIYNIYEDFAYITKRAVAVQLLSLVMMFAFVKTEGDFVIYACITVLASGGAFVFNYLHAKKYYRPKLVLHCNVRTHLKPMLLLGANLVAVVIYVNADTTMLGYMIDEREVGLYSTAVKVYSIIKHIVVAVVATATARLSFFYHNGQKDEYKSLAVKMAKVLLLFAVPASIGIFMLSDEIILLIAGEAYLESSLILKILSFAIIFATFGCYFSTYDLIISRREKKVLLFTSISAVVNILLNIFFIPYLGARGAAITTVISEFVVFIAFAKLAKIELYRNILNTMLTVALATMWVVAVCLFFSFIDFFVVKLVVSIFVSVLGYIGIVLLRKEDVAIKEFYAMKIKIQRILKMDA